MRRAKILWIELLVAVLISVFVIINGYFSTNITNAYVFKLIARFFGYAPCVGIYIAIFSAWLWGNDYEYGTLRNKMVCGRNRSEVYLSHLLSSMVAALAVMGAYLAVHLVLGVPILGYPSLTLTTAQIVICILSSLLMAAALASVCCLLASLVKNKAGGVLLCLSVVVAMIIIGVTLYDRFSEPEIEMNVWVWWGDNVDEKWHPENERYVGGWARIVMELVICVIPGAQGVLLMEQAVEHYAFPAIGSVIIICLTTLAGIKIFQQKDFN